MKTLSPPAAVNTASRIQYRLIKDLFLIVAGVLTAGMGLKGFLLPNNFLDGGAMGIALLLELETGLALALLVVLVNAPFIWMGYRQISGTFAAKTLLAIGLLALCLVQFTAMVMRGEEPLKRLRVARPVAVSLLLYLGWLTLQLNAPTEVLRSVDMHSTAQQLLISCGYLAGFFLVLMNLRHGADLRQFVKSIVLLGVLQALLAVYLYSARVDYELFYFAVDHSSRTFGTFSYHNSLANYLVICLCLGIGLLVSDLRAAPLDQAGWRSRAVRWLSAAFSEVVQLRVMLLVMVVALVLTKSRMGNAAFMLALLCVAAPVLVLKGHLRLKGGLLILSIIILDVFFVGQMVGFDEVAQRLNKTASESVEGVGEESLESRSAPARLAMAMVHEKPWTGRGAGTFYTTFPQYTSPEARLYYDHAHNDYVQFLVEVGLPGAGLLALAVLSTLVRSAFVLQRPKSPLDMGLALGAVMAILAVLLQATVDFHFQIPANALLFVTVLAIPWLLRRHPKPHH